MITGITTRRENRKEFKREEKIKLLRLDRELRKLVDQKYDMPLVPLEKPIRNGYKKTFILRDDIARREDADVLWKVLKEVNTTVYCSRKDFIAKNYKTKKMEPIKHGFRPVSKPRWDELEALWTPREIKWFSKYSYLTLESCPVHKHGYLKGLCNCRYTTMPIFYVVDKIDIHYLTHYRPIDPDLETKISELRHYLYANDLYRKIWKYQTGALGYFEYGYDDRKRKLINKCINSELYEWQSLGFEEPYNDPYYQFKDTKL